MLFVLEIENKFHHKYNVIIKTNVDNAILNALTRKPRTPLEDRVDINLSKETDIPKLNITKMK